jgi:hypothetical protein
VSGYTWQYKVQTTLKKYKNFKLFVEQKIKQVYPSFCETKTGEETCRSKHDYDTFAKRCNADINKYNTDNGAFRTVIFQKEIDEKGKNISFSDPC